MATPSESKVGLLTLGAMKYTADSSNRSCFTIENTSSSSSSDAVLTERVANRDFDRGAASSTKQEPGQTETKFYQVEASNECNNSEASWPLLTASGAFFQRMTSKFSSYATACRGVSNIGDWMSINNKYFGSSVLYTDEISTGLLFGYCAGYAFNRALRFGALLCGIGFISLQTLHHFGYIQVNWKRLEEDLRRPLDVNGDGKVDQEDVAALQKRLLKFMAQGVPSTAGLSLGLLWGLRAGK